MAHEDATNPLFFEWEGAGRRKRNIPADAIARAGRVGRGLMKGGGSLVGADDGLLPCGGGTTCRDDENFIMAAGAKWLGRSFFVDKTNLGG